MDMFLLYLVVSAWSSFGTHPELIVNEIPHIEVTTPKIKYMK